MEENLNKHPKRYDPISDEIIVNFDEVIYNGLDKVQIRECIVNDERKSPEMVVSYTYFHTEND